MLWKTYKMKVNIKNKKYKFVKKSIIKLNDISPSLTRGR